MSRGMSRKGFVLFSVIFVLVLACLLGITVSGHSEERAEREQYLAIQEQSIAQEMRSVLGQAGFRNSGVNITHVVDAQGNRSYTVQIHHQDILKQEEYVQEQLQQQLRQVFSANTELGDFYHQVDFF